VAISTLITAPYSLDYGEVVYAKFSATNIKGTSDYSPVGSGGIIADSPDIPISFVSTEATSASQISLSWSPGPEFYGLNVQDYMISYDQGLADGSQHILEGGIVDTTYTLTPVV
jgi:hypothetical protein